MGSYMQLAAAPHPQGQGANAGVPSGTDVNPSTRHPVPTKILVRNQSGKRDSDPGELEGLLASTPAQKD